MCANVGVSIEYSVWTTFYKPFDFNCNEHTQFENTEAKFIANEQFENTIRAIMKKS